MYSPIISLFTLSLFLIMTLASTAFSFWTRARTYAFSHKFVSAIVLCVLLGGGYYAYSALTSTTGQTSYVVSTVATGTVVATLSESGQVAATSDVQVQAKASGEVLQLLVKPGQHVMAGTAIAYLDSTDAQKAVKSAQQNLLATQISIGKASEPATASQITNAENAVASAEANLVQAHTSGYNDVSSTFLDLPNIVAGLDTILHGSTVPGRTNQMNENAYADMLQTYDTTVNQYEYATENAYQTASLSYTTALADYKSASRTADDDQIEALTKESYQAAANLSDALKAATNFLNFVNTSLTNRKLAVPSTLTSQITALTNYTNTVNNHVSALSGDMTSVTSAARSLAAAQASLTELKAARDTYDVQSDQLSLQQKQDALTTAEEGLADTVVRAPFSGTVAAVSVDRYQTIGSGTAVATMVSDDAVADISLNEEDAAKIKVGQKATLTFDALSDVTIAGTVSSINTVGTVTQGVVSYAATIALDTKNDSVLPGMTVNASIVIGSGDGLVVPSSAVKTSGTSSYVLVFTPALDTTGAPSTGVVTTRTPTRVTVTTGLASDTETLITSGLSGGEQVVSRSSTVSKTTTTTTKAASVGGGGPGAIRL